MSQTPVKPDHESPPRTPHWVKVIGIIAVILILLIFIAFVTGLGGSHGPGRHILSSGTNGYYTPALQQL